VRFLRVDGFSSGRCGLWQKRHIHLYSILLPNQVDGIPREENDAATIDGNSHIPRFSRSCLLALFTPGHQLSCCSVYKSAHLIAISFLHSTLFSTRPHSVSDSLQDHILAAARSNDIVIYQQTTRVRV